jgi:hypothetical protein
MKSLRYAKLGAVFALALGAAVPASLIVATPAAAHEQYRDNDHRGDHGNFRGDHHFRTDGHRFDHGRWDHHRSHRFWFGR